MNILGADVPTFAVLFGSLIGALFLGIGINISGELVKSLYKVLLKKRFEKWLQKFDHHNTKVIKVVTKKLLTPAKRDSIIYTAFKKKTTRKEKIPEKVKSKKVNDKPKTKTRSTNKKST